MMPEIQSPLMSTGSRHNRTVKDISVRIFWWHGHMYRQAKRLLYVSDMRFTGCVSGWNLPTGLSTGIRLPPEKSESAQPAGFLSICRKEHRASLPDISGSLR